MTDVVSLAPLEFGTVIGPGVPIPGFLIVLRDGRRLLVDTGCAPGPSEFFARNEALDLDRSAISTVIVTHFDPDHVGANDEYPHASFVAQRAQYEHARTSGLHRYEWMRPHWDDPRLRYTLVDGDHDLVPGVTLIECGGHVPGHQAVLVTLPHTGKVLLAGDAWMRDTDPSTRPMSPFDLDEAATRAAQRRLMTVASDQDVALVIHNHDAAQWAGLDQVYR